ncbi:MAG: branched-chain amino acid ABC transporter permease [Chloroflexales bacterium]
MNKTTRAWLTGGIFGGLIALISAGLIGFLAGIIAGMITGLLIAQTTILRTPFEGFRRGVQSGLIAGVFVVVGQLLRGLLINPIIDPRHAGLQAVYTAALGGLMLSGLVAGLFGAINTLPVPRNRTMSLGLIILLVIAYPWLDQLLELRFMNEIIPVIVFVLMALGLNIVVGYAGLLDLGYAAFFAIGAYTTGLLASPHLGVNLSIWIAIWIAAAVAAIFGLILGAPTLPLRGDYLAIVTLGFGEIVPIAVNNLDKLSINILGYNIVKDFDLTGGPKGINPISRPWLPFIGEFRADSPIPWYYLILVIMALSIFFIMRLRDSRIGRAWMAMREDELAASSMGIDIVRTKLMAFSMGATFSGFAGAFYGSYISAIFPSSFAFDVSVMLLCMVILGGMGNITGVIVGGLIIQLADRLFLPQLSQLVQKLFEKSDISVLKELNFASDFRLLLFGLTLVIMMNIRPEGLLPSADVRAELHDGDDEPVVGAGVKQTA